MDRRILAGVLVAGVLVLLGLGWVLLVPRGPDEAGASGSTRPMESRKVTRFAPSPLPPEGAPAPDAPSGTAPRPEASVRDGPGAPGGSTAADGEPTEADVPDLGIDISAWPVSADGIKGAMGEVTPAIKDCYDTHLADVPDLAGRLAVGFTIEEVEGIGRITGVEASESTVDDGPLEDCVLGVVGALQFDAPEHGQIRVNYPFVFSNGE